VLEQPNREQYFEVVVQVEPGGHFNDDPLGGQQHPDYGSASRRAQVLEMQPGWKCVRVRWVTLDWLMPGDPAAAAALPEA
jgi:hypothetical protein